MGAKPVSGLVGGKSATASLGSTWQFCAGWAELLAPLFEYFSNPSFAEAANEVSWRKLGVSSSDGLVKFFSGHKRTGYS